MDPTLLEQPDFTKKCTLTVQEIMSHPLKGHGAGSNLFVNQTFQESQKGHLSPASRSPSGSGQEPHFPRSATMCPVAIRDQFPVTTPEVSVKSTTHLHAHILCVAQDCSTGSFGDWFRFPSHNSSNVRRLYFDRREKCCVIFLADAGRIRDRQSLQPG